MSIKVQKVSKLYGSQKSLDCVSFEISKGEIVGFLGPNGAGKSTMMKIIAGFIPHTTGKVLVNDMDVLRHSKEIRRIIGYLPEHNPLYHDMYVKEYLLYVAGLYKLGTSRGPRVGEMIDLTGLGQEQHKKIGALSKGYRQRVGLAQALIHDPQVLILDEPTTGLDPNQLIEVRNLIRDIGQDKTVMLSTHIMQEVEAICKRVIIIDKGKLVADERELQSFSSSTDYQEVEVEFRGDIPLDRLRQCEWVDSINDIGDNRYVIVSHDREDLRYRIFRFAVENNMVILEIYCRKKSMEKVFQELTGR